MTWDAVSVSPVLSVAVRYQRSIRLAFSHLEQPLALRRSEVLCSTARATAATKSKEKMRPGSVFGLTTLGLVSRTSMDDRLGDGPPLWEGEQQFHAFVGYALLTAMAAACAHSVSHSSRRWRH